MQYLVKYPPSSAQLQVKMTLLLSAVAVPINTVFGVTSAILIARNEFPGKLVVMSMLDLPFSISPVVTGQPPLLPLLSSMTFLSPKPKTLPPVVCPGLAFVPFLAFTAFATQLSSH